MNETPNPHGRDDVEGMTMKSRISTFAPLLAWFALVGTACDGQAVVFSNAFLMGVTCFMLWSTLNLKRDDQ